MKKNVTVFYESVRISGGEEERFSETTDGVLNEKDGEIYITYKDSLGTAVLKIKGMEISAIRFGENANTFKFKSGRLYACPYKTPYGVFETIIKTHTAVCEETELGGVASLAYTLDFAGEKSEHTFKLIYKIK